MWSMCRNHKGRGRSFPQGMMLAALSMTLLLAGCGEGSKLVTDTGSGKTKSVAREDYLLLNENNSTGGTAGGKYQVLTLEKGTFEEGALSQTLRREMNNLPEIRLDSDGKDVRFVEYKAGYYDYVEVGDTIATVAIDADDIAIKEQKQNLARLEERFVREEAQVQETLAEMAEERKAIYNTYQNQIAGLQEHQTRMDWENKKYNYEQQIAEAKERLAELTEAGEIYEVKTDRAGYVLLASGYVSGSTLQDGAYICNIMDGMTVFTSTDTQADQFPYGTEVLFSTREGDVIGRVVNGGELGLYGNLNTKQAVFKLTFDKQLQTLDHWNGVNNLIMRANLKIIENVIIIPKDAVTEQDGEYYVTVLREDGTLIQTEFIPGGSNGDSLWVLRGLDEGTQIVYK